jgi:hypothetical protein
LFVAVSVNQARILALGRMADRGLEALAMLFLVLVVALLALVPAQPLRLFGAETFLVDTPVLLALLPLRRGYIGVHDPASRPRSVKMVRLNRTATALIALAGLVLLVWADGAGLYVLATGILLSFIAAGANAWVLLIEITR